jgi:site-specific recombinase XerD
MSEAVIQEYLGHLDRMCGFSMRSLGQQQWILRFWTSFLQKSEKGLMEAKGSDFLEYMESRSRTVRRTTVAKEVSALRGLYDFLFSFGKISHNPSANLPELMSEPHPESSWLTVAECFKLLGLFDTSNPLGLRNYTIAALLWSTGLRASELCALEWRDIDFAEGALRVRKGKGGKQRQIFLNHAILSHMLRYRTQADGGPGDPVFYAFSKNQTKKKKHARLSERRLTEIIREHAEAAGFSSNVTPVSFRHSFATHMAEAGAAMEDIKEILGHDDETETTIYVHVSQERMKRFLYDHMGNPHKEANDDCRNRSGRF